MADLFDDPFGVEEPRIDEQQQPESLEDIFGDDGLDAGPGPGPGGLLVEQEPLQPPSPVAGGDDAAAERKRALAALAQRAAARGDGGSSGDEQDGGGGGGSGKKRRRRDKERDGGGGERRRARLQKRARAPGGGGEGGGGAGGGGREDEGVGLEDEVPQEDEGDRAFIDDDGVPEHQRYRDNPEADYGGEPEAEEAEEGDLFGDEEEGAAGGDEDELSAALKKRRRKQVDTDAERQVAVENMVSRMLMAAKLDEEAVQAGKPATHKVKALAAVEGFLRQRKHHEFFIINGGLGAAAKWVHPYGNGALPTLTVRAKVAELLALLPIDTSNETLRDILSGSGLGKVVTFHAQFDGDRTDREIVVQRAYKKLLHTWLAPIVHDPSAEADKRDRQAADLERQRRLSQRRRAAEADVMARRRAADAAVAPGQKGFRKHAYIPSAAKLDYVVNPGGGGGGGGSSGGGGPGPRRRRGDEEDEDDDGGFGAMAAVAPEPGRGGGGGGGGRAGPAELNPLERRAREMARNRKGATARAAKVSVEGRGIL